MDPSSPGRLLSCSHSFAASATVKMLGMPTFSSAVLRPTTASSSKCVLLRPFWFSKDVSSALSAG